MSFLDYYLLIQRIKAAVETFTGVIWEFPDYSPEVERLFKDPELFSLHRFPSVPIYRYMVYLRHHGFPSPLLDWTSSPYVAAFFAFREPIPESEKRAIYAYCETSNVKGGAVGAPTMRPIGPYVRSHRRHFRQQSDYTICGILDQMKGWCFYPHEEVLNARNDQDLVWKFNVPSTERIKVLKLLNEYNLNAYSLFDTEETLLETMWEREHTLKL